MDILSREKGEGGAASEQPEGKSAFQGGQTESAEGQKRSVRHIIHFLLPVSFPAGSKFPTGRRPAMLMTNLNHNHALSHLWTGGLNIFLKGLQKKLCLTVFDFYQK